jgi:NADPH2:quinone reductase
MDQPAPSLMRAVVVRRFGPPEVMRVDRIDCPSDPGPRQVLVRVCAAGVNPVDAQNRSDGGWAALELPFVPGSDASGVIVAVGSAVEGFTSGDEVIYFSDFLGNRRGSYAEYQVVDADVVARRPTKLSHVETAAVPLAGGTAYELAVRRLELSPEQWLLIFGAAGGVGSFLVQIAKARGARIAAIASAPNHDYLRALGADLTFDYRAEDVVSSIADEVGPVDAVADLVGGDVVQRSLPVLREGGRAASICALTGDFELAIDRNITLHGVLVRPDGDRVTELAMLLADGRVSPPAIEVFGLEDVVASHKRIERGHGRGRVVLDLVGDMT